MSTIVDGWDEAQRRFDQLDQRLARGLIADEFLVATIPDATLYEGRVIYVSDGGAGAVFQGSNGTAWVNLG